MKKKELNAKRSKRRRKADCTRPPEQEASERTAPATPQRSGPPQTAPSAQTWPPQETGARQESPEQIEIEPLGPPAAEGTPPEPLEYSDSEDTAAEGPGQEAPAAGGNAGSDDGSEAAEELEFDEAMVEHVQLLANLIDGQDLSREETIQVLRRIMRQHSIATETGLDYAVRKVKEKPP